MLRSQDSNASPNARGCAHPPPLDAHTAAIRLSLLFEELDGFLLWQTGDMLDTFSTSLESFAREHPALAPKAIEHFGRLQRLLAAICRHADLIEAQSRYFDQLAERLEKEGYHA